MILPGGVFRAKIIREIMEIGKLSSTEFAGIFFLFRAFIEGMFLPGGVFRAKISGKVCNGRVFRAAVFAIVVCHSGDVMVGWVL